MSTEPLAQPSAYGGPSAILNNTNLASAHMVRLPNGPYMLATNLHDTRMFVRDAARPYTSRSPVRITLHDSVVFEYEDAGKDTMPIRVRC